MNPLIFLILGLALMAALVSAWGRRTNLVLQGKIAGCLEDALEPADASFTDIGGVVGFTYEFTRSGIPDRVSGSLTLFPRQALFYYPIAKFLGREDALILLAPMPGLPFGEGHLLHRRQWEEGRIDVDDAADMESDEIMVEGTELIILSYNSVVHDLLLRFAEGYPRLEDLRHFSYSRSNDSFYLQVDPHPETLVPGLAYWAEFLAGLSAPSEISQR